MEQTFMGASAKTRVLKFSLFYEILTRFYSKLAQNKPSKVYKSLKIVKKIKKILCQKIVYFTKILPRIIKQLSIYLIN